MRHRARSHAPFPTGARHVTSPWSSSPNRTVAKALARKVYYLSDRSGAEGNVLNVWSYDLDSKETKQVTRFKLHDVKWPAIGPDAGGAGEMVLQHGDRIYTLDLGTGASRAVDITVPGDRASLRAAVVDAAENIQGASISPSGKRVAVVGRGV